MHFFIGNETTAVMELQACELCGFNLGAFEERVFKPGDAHPHVVPWRLPNDLAYVAVNHKLVALCDFLHLCVTEKGLAEIQIKDHQISSRMHVPASWPRSECQVDLMN